MARESESARYKAAGVDITAGYEAVRLIAAHARRTTTPGVLSPLGGFGGLFQLDLSETPRPVLVSGTDGVGTKLRLAFLMDKHNTIGIDCVAMCVNDVAACGAKPLYFLDYLACGKLDPVKAAAVVEGVAAGCIEAGCALIGGETAEMPGFYPPDEYDLAGFCTGLADASRLFNPAAIKAGDALIALPSSGVHSNGFSLIRSVFQLDDRDAARRALADYSSVLGRPLGEELLEPTRLYVKPLLRLAGEISVHSAAHITGGGFFENIPRSLPEGIGARLTMPPDAVTPIFRLIAEKGAVGARDMFNTFNMGVGMTVVVDKADRERAVALLREEGVAAFSLGEAVAGGGVAFEGGYERLLE